jgi:hypothetical protein
MNFRRKGNNLFMGIEFSIIILKAENHNYTEMAMSFAEQIHAYCDSIHGLIPK